MTIEPTFEIVPADAGIEEKAKLSLEQAFSGFFAQAEDWNQKALTISDPKLARVARLELKNIRVAAEKKRKELKEESLRMGKAIDGANNILLALIVPIEKKLEDLEKAEERKEAARKEALKQSRIEALAPYNIDTQFYTLGEMTEEAFTQLLENTQAAHKAKLEAALKLEEERIAKEKAEAEERERIRKENEELKKRALEDAEKARKEREQLEAKAKAERQEMEKKNAEAAAKAKAERDEAERVARIEQDRLKAIAEKERQEREKLEAKAAEEKRATEAKAKKEAQDKKKAALAPDCEKLKAFAKSVRAMELPIIGEPAMASLELQVKALADWAEKTAKTLLDD